MYGDGSDAPSARGIPNRRNTVGRTTLRLPEDLLKEAKKRAAERGTTLTALVESSDAAP